MKLPIILACVAALTGCLYQSVDQSDLRKSAEFCKGADNVLNIKAGALGGEWVKCMDGSVKEYWGPQRAE